MKYKFLILIATLFMSAEGLQAQGAKVRNTYAWSFGAQLGGTTYFGDLNHKFFPPNRNDWAKMGKNYDSYAVGLSLEKRLTGALGLSFNGMYGNVTGNDRTMDWSGKLVSDNPNLARSLNFRTEFYDLSANVVYNFANGFLIRNNAKFSPYISAGVGLMNFATFGDLYTGDGARYYYWNDNTIRNAAQNDPNSISAQEIKQDGEYETRLSGDYKIEGNDYATNFVLTIPVSLGVKMRLADRWDLSLNATGKYLFSDYFDDVSGAKYPSTANMSSQQQYILNPNAANWSTREHEVRGNANGMNDIVGFIGLGIHHRFGMQLRKFKGPRFYSQEPVRKSITPIAPTSNPTMPSNPTQPINLTINNQENISALEAQMKEMQALQGEKDANANKEMERLMAEMKDLKDMQNRLELSSALPSANNPELAERVHIVEMRLDSIREKEIAIEEQKLLGIESQIARKEMTINTTNPDTVGLAKLKVERKVSVSKREKLRRQKKSKDVEVKKMQDKIDLLNAKVDSLYTKKNGTDLQDEVALMRLQMETMRAEMDRMRLTQSQVPQPVQIYNSTPQPQQPVYQQPVYQQPTQQAAPIIIQSPAQAPAPQNNAQLDQMTLALNQMNRNLEAMAARMNAMENKQPIIQQAAPTPVIVNTPAPIVQQAAPTPAPVYITQSSSVNVGLSKVSVYFANGVSAIASQYKQLLSEVARESQKDGRIIISLNSFASTNGNQAANQKLSEARAANVRKYLMSQGVSVDRIVVQSFGESVSSSTTESDRRVDVELLNR